MRFHFGVSLRPNISWLKWLGLAIIGLLAFFGIGNHVVLAATSGTVNMVPTSVGVFNEDSSSLHNLTIQHRTGSTSILGDNYYVNFSSASCGGGVACSPVYEGEVRWTYPAKNLCSSGQKLNYHFVYFVRPDNNHGQLFDSNSLSLGGVSSYNIISRTLDTGINAYVVDLQVPNNSSFTLQFGFDNDYNNFAYFASSSVSEKWTYSCDYTLADSTADIIDSASQNTEQIIGSITDDSISSDTIDTGNDFFDNFSTSSTTGFSGIINAPIRIFQSMVNNNACVPLVLPFSLNDGSHSGSANVSLPCGNILWDNAPQAVVLMWHTIIFGVLGYRLLIDLVKFVNNLLNPNSTNEYVMDL